MKTFNIFDKSQAKQLVREIKLLSKVQCDALIALKGAFFTDGTVGMIIEYMDKGSLEFLMDHSVPGLSLF